MRKRWLAGAALLMLLVALVGAGGAGGADGTNVTYTATQTIPVPPVSDFSGSGGGDGWAVALTPTSVYNVHHHLGQLTVACHLQAKPPVGQTGAQPCWTGNLGETRTITQTLDGRTTDFESSGHPGLWIDQATGHLYTFATRSSDSTGGVVCIDTGNAATNANPFCGFTALTATGEAFNSGYSALSAPAVVGSRWFAFNYFSGSAATGTKNKLLCFDLNTFGACAGQPFTVSLGTGAAEATVSASLPSPVVAAMGTQVIVPINFNGVNRLACFDGAGLKDCTGAWPVDVSGVNYPSQFSGSAGAPFPLLTAAGDITGLCLPTGTVPCYSLTGASVATPAGLADAIDPPTTPWNGPAFVLGPRVYVPNGNSSGSGQVHCYDYNLSKSCTNFPKSFANLGYLYTVNSDPQRPACIWVNADNGDSQIQNFDAFTGGPCGEGAIRVLASSSVVSTPLCTPGSWTSLQITSPSPSSYTSGSVAFQDASGVAIPGVGNVSLDGTGTASLTGLNLGAGAGLPQFLITLNGTQGAPGEVVVKLTWVGVFDPSCGTKPGTTVVNPPSNAPTTPAAPAAPAAPAKADVRVILSPPAYGRAGAPMTFRALVNNNGPDTSTGVVLRMPIPPGAVVDSATTTIGSGCVRSTVITCFIGTLASGALAQVNVVLHTPNTGPLTMSASLEGDNDPAPSNNSTSAATTVVGPNDPPPAPPAPSQPGTFNAFTTGTVIINGVSVPADVLVSLKSGDIVDVTNGIVTITSAQGWVGTFSSQKQPRPRAVSSRKADGVLPAIFQITQTTAPDDPVLLTLMGGDFNTCTTPRRLSATNTSPVRALWGSARGTFRTKARYSSATVRGTIWLTQDRCDGSYNQVDEGVVDVLDEPLNKTVTVNAGQSYLAKAPTAAKKPPAQKRKAKAKKVKRKQAAPKPTFYIVRPGDSLSSIATAKLGRENRWAELARLNGLRPPYHVEPGKKLKLPQS